MEVKELSITLTFKESENIMSNLDIELQEQIKNAKCKICLDDMLPQYGKAPHIPIIGGAILNTKDFPDNFEPELMEGETLEDCKTGTYYCTNKECKNHRNNYKE